MSLTKKAKNQLIKLFFGNSAVPRSLFELHQYFRLYGPINFRFEKGENDRIIAVSNNFQYGVIVTSGKDGEDLDKNIKDAILTSFEVPSSYAQEAQIQKVGNQQEVYALV